MPEITVRFTAIEVDELKVVSPLYFAVSECVPTASDVVEKVATQEGFNVPVPKFVVPSLKVTVPVGVLLPDGPVTFAVRATFCPAATVVADTVNAVSDEAGEVPPEAGEVPPPEDDCNRNVPEPSRSIVPSPLIS